MEKFIGSVKYSMELSPKVQSLSEAGKMFIDKIMNSDPCANCAMVCDPNCAYFVD